MYIVSIVIRVVRVRPISIAFRRHNKTKYCTISVAVFKSLKSQLLKTYDHNMKFIEFCQGLK